MNGAAANNDTVTVGTQTYTFTTTAISGSSAANSVLVGTTEAQSLANLAAAINDTSGAGTNYSCEHSHQLQRHGGGFANGGHLYRQNRRRSRQLARGNVGNASRQRHEYHRHDWILRRWQHQQRPADRGGCANCPDSDQQRGRLRCRSSRGNIGGTVNRLQAATNVITNQTQNLTAAENDVTAADIPSTVAKLSQDSILMQTGVSALAQANQQQQLVLKLLQ